MGENAAPHYTGRLMADSVLRRRAGVVAGMYASVVFGLLGTVVAAHVFTRTGLGLFAIVIASSSFFQSLLDLTIEEALIKYGFRYIENEDWGKLRRLFRRVFAFKATGALLAAVALLVLARFSRELFHHGGLARPLAIASLMPLVQSAEGIAGIPLYLRGRYDIRGGFLALSMALRLAAIAIAAPHGLSWTIAALVGVQGLATLLLSVAGFASFRRFPRHDVEPLGADAREILRFIGQSSLASGVVSVRTMLSQMLMGMVSTITQAAYFRVALAPQQGFNAVSAPIRMVLLTEQTQDWERGNRQRVFAGVRRYTLAALLGSAVLLPVLLLLMHPIVRLLFSAKNLGAVDAARVIVVAGCVQFVVGWAKSFAVTIGQPQLRIWTHGLETVVLIPLVVVLGLKWGAIGAAVAVLVSSVAYAAAWFVLFERIRHEPEPPPPHEHEHESSLVAEIGTAS
jgi:O-antigen/teichoic acid export membrane protein